jgi:hypothetical protein
MIDRYVIFALAFKLCNYGSFYEASKSILQKCFMGVTNRRNICWFQNCLRNGKKIASKNLINGSKSALNSAFVAIHFVSFSKEIFTSYVHTLRCTVYFGILRVLLKART